MNNRTKIAIGIILSFLLIFYLFYKIDFNSVVQSIIKFNAWVLLILLTVYIAGMFLRTYRWQLLITQREDLNKWLVFKALAIGYMVNNLLPARIGELARMEYLKRKKNIARSFLLGTIYIERIIDLILVLLIFSFSLIFSQSGRTMFLQNKWIFLAIFILIMSSFFLMLSPGNLIKMLSFLPVKVRFYIEKFFHSFSESIYFVKDRNLFFRISLQSLFIWFLTLLTSYLILSGLNVSLPFYGYFFLVAVGVLGLIIPSTSGGIGVFHAIATAALVLMGVQPDKALAYAIIAHAFDFIPNIIIGLAVTIIEGISFKSLTSVKPTDSISG
jgi:uncharacterized protein (TIRG00374 family)